MFATLLGSLPRPPLPADAPLRALVEAVVRAQEAAGLEPVTDGGLLDAADPVAAWEATAALTDRAVKQAVGGPYTAGRSGRGTVAQRTTAILARAGDLNDTLRDLAAAGCPLIEIHEPAATAIGGRPRRTRALPRRPPAAARRRGPARTSRSRSPAATPMPPGSRRSSPPRTPASPSTSSPVPTTGGSWRSTPGDRGIVCGALSAAADQRRRSGDPALGGGLRRVDEGPRPGARRARHGVVAGAPAVGRRRRARSSASASAARIAGLPAGRALSPSLDPRAVSSRSAALGRVEPTPSRRPRRGQDPT